MIRQYKTELLNINNKGVAMSKYSKPMSATSSVKPSTTAQDINKTLHPEQPPHKKQLQRKPSHKALQVKRSKNVSKQSYNPLESPRYMVTTPLKLIPIVQSITNQGEINRSFMQDLKTQRKDVPNQKSTEKSARQKKYNEDSADYYKYWKKKANQYQEENFNLHRINSSLQQENEILKNKIERVQKKMIKLYQPQPTKVIDNSQNYEKLENYYRAKVDQLSKKISQQQLLIEKKDKKIKQLSKYISQNYQLKNLLDNMQQRISQMRSVGSKQDSRTNSIQKMSQKGKQVGKKYSDRLAVNYQSPLLNTRSNYTIKGRKNLSGFNDDNKSFSGRGY